MSRQLEREQIREAIRQLREQIRWKPGSVVRHLAKRIELGHLASTATIATYEALIIRIVTTPRADVFVYHWGETRYLTIVADVEGVRWLVMSGFDGMMETAFPPDDPEMYLSNARFSRVGSLEELE
jgi:hypothetical protein